MKIDKKDLLVYFGFLAVVLVFFFRLLDGQEVLAFKDLSRYFYPLRFLMVEMVKSGQLPLWNPYIFCGMPFLATLQIGFFYPLTIIHYFLPFDLAFNYYTVLHYYLAAIFMYWLMRHYQLSRSGAFMSGLVFAFSGYLVSVNNMNTTLTSVIWLPLVILFWDKVLGHRSYVIGLVIALALMFLGGEPTIIYITGWLMFFYALILYRVPLANTLRLALAFIVAALLVSVQLLPFIELLWHSDRGMLSNFEIISRWSLPPREMINFILPFFFGNPLRAGNYSEVLLGADIQSWLLSPYLGFIPLFLAGLGLIKKDKRGLFFAGAGLVGLLLALGRYTPLYFLFYKLIPGVSLIRYPVKYLFLVTFAAAALAGWGLEELRSRLKVRYLFVFTLLIGVSTLLLNLFKEPGFKVIGKFYPQSLPPFFMAELWRTYSFDIQSITYLFFFLLAVTLSIWLAKKKYLSLSILNGILIALVMLDLLVVNSSLTYPADRSVYHDIPENIRILTEDKDLFRYDYSSQVEKSFRRIGGVDFRQALIDSLDRLTPNRLIPYGLYDLNGYESVVLRDYRELTQKYPKGMPLQMTNEFNIKYAATANPINYPGYTLVRKAEYFNGQVYLYRNNNCLPRAYVQGRKDPCKIVKYSPHEIIIETTLKAPGELFLSDTYYPGWKAYDNGKEVKIHRAKYMFRGVKLSKGEHNIRFVYDPLSFKLGATLTLMTILGLVLFAVIERKRGLW